MKRLLVQSFGCQMNVYDGELMASAFRRAGYTLARDPEEADVILINTCAVRERAEEKVFSHLGHLRRIKERNPGLVLGVTGCMAERMGKEISRRAPYVDVIAGARSFGGIVGLAEAVRETAVFLTPAATTSGD